MKIALCLSGHLRKFEETYPSLYKCLLSRYDCDIFVHTWDTIGYGSVYKIDYNHQMPTDKKLDAFTNLYKPKKIIIEPSDFIEDLKKQGDKYAPHLKNCPKHVGHMASMFYKIYAANELRKMSEIETGIKYDLIIRSRTDLMFNAPINIPSNSSGKIYLCKHQCSHDWYNDQFAIASPEEMDLYCSFFFNMSEYFSARNEYYPEKFMAWSFKKAQLVPDLLDLHYSILR